MPLKSSGRRRGLHAALCGLLVTTGASASAQPLTEAQAIERALARSEFGELGEANRDEAEARVAGIRSLDNPEATISRESVSGDGRSETEWQIGVVQPIDISGRRARLRAAARAEIGAVEADTARRRQTRVADVRRAYSGCAAAGERVRVRAAFVERLHEAERIISARASAGDAAVYDLRRLRVEARIAEAETAVQEGEVRAFCSALAALTGIADARPTASLAFLTRNVAPPPGASTRPDLVAREQRLAAAGEQLNAAQRARLPDLLVGAGLKQIEGDGGSAAGPVFSLGMRVPLFDGGSSSVAEARARVRAQEAELGLARREVEASVVEAEARHTAALEGLQRMEQAAEDARRIGPIAEAAYQGGEAGVVELIDAYRTARDAELEIIEGAERVARTRIELDLSQGRLS